MQLLLGEGEQLIHSWDYAVQKKLIGFKRRYSLSVTNRRLIQTETLKRGVSRKDFAVDNISGVEVDTNSMVKVSFIILALLYLALAIVMFAAVGDTVGIILGVVFLVFAVVFLILALNNSALSVRIYTDGVPTTVAGAVSSRFKLSAKTIKLKVNKQNCQEIVANLSKLILIDLKRH